MHPAVRPSWQPNTQPVGLAGSGGKHPLRHALRFPGHRPSPAELLKASRNLSFFTSFYRFLIQLLPAAVVAPLYFRGEIEFGVINQSASGGQPHLEGLAGTSGSQKAEVEGGMRADPAVAGQQVQRRRLQAGAGIGGQRPLRSGLLASLRETWAVQRCCPRHLHLQRAAGRSRPTTPHSGALPAPPRPPPPAAFNHILTDVSLVVYQFEAIAGFSGGPPEPAPGHRAGHQLPCRQPLGARRGQHTWRAQRPPRRSRSSAARRTPPAGMLV